MGKNVESKTDPNIEVDESSEDIDPFLDSPEEEEISEEGGEADPFNFSEEPPPVTPKKSTAPLASKKVSRTAKAKASSGGIASAKTGGRSAGLAADLPVQMVAVMGKKIITVKELVSLKKGQVVELNRFPNEAVDLVANGRLIAKGELIEIDGKLGIRIIKIFE